MNLSNSQYKKITPHHRFIYLNGDFNEQCQGNIPISTQAFNYGTAVFEGIRGYTNISNTTLNVFRLDEHINRLQQSASILKINDLPESYAIKELIIELLKLNQVERDCYIRPIAFKQALLPNSAFGVKLSGISTGFSINSLDMGVYTNDNGIACTISSWRRISDNAIPARAKINGGYVNSALAMETAVQAGYDDAIMLNNNGYVAESTTSNIFIVKSGRLITPPTTAHILEGITRDSVIELARELLGLEVYERDILPSELLTVEECFLTGTGVEITLVRQIDCHNLKTLESDSISIKIKEMYTKIVRGEITDFSRWLTPVK